MKHHIIMMYVFLMLCCSITVLLFIYIEKFASYKKKKYFIKNKTYEVYGIKICEPSFPKLLSILIIGLIWTLFSIIFFTTTFFT